MKKIFVSAVVCCLAACAALFTSCEPKNFNETTCFIGVLEQEQYNTNSAEDKALFEQYLTSKGFKNTGEGAAFGFFDILKWNDNEDYNQVLEALWEPYRAKLSYDELDALALSDAFHATLGVSTGKSKTEQHPVITWLYPNPSESVQWTLTNNPMTVPTAGAQGLTFTVQCNKSWTSQANRDWVTYSPTSGEANVECTITVNIAAGPKDSAEIVFTPRHSTRTETMLIFREDD